MHEVTEATAVIDRSVGVHDAVLADLRAGLHHRAGHNDGAHSDDHRGCDGGRGVYEIGVVRALALLRFAVAVTVIAHGDDGAPDLDEGFV